MKGKDKTPGKQPNEVEIGNLPKKKKIHNASEDDPGSWIKNGGKDWEDAINVYQRLEELKNNQTEMNNTLEGMNSRITDAEEQISDLEDRMVEITAAEQTI